MNHFHGGQFALGKKQYIDFSANTSPLGMHPSAQKELERIVVQKDSPLCAYPDSSCTELRSLIADYWGAQKECVVCGAGAVDLIYEAAQLGKEKALIIQPAFTEYKNAIHRNEHIKEIINFTLTSENDFAFTETDCKQILLLIKNFNPSIVFAALPANPTGQIIPGKIICSIAEACEETGAYLVIDACFAQFSAESEKTIRTILRGKKKYPHAIIINAFTKYYGMAGIRLGYAIANSKLTAESICNAMRPWSVSSEAQRTGCAVLKTEIAARAKHDESPWDNRMRSLVAQEKQRIVASLEESGCHVIHGNANFVLCRMRAGKNLYSALLKQNIVIRTCEDFEGCGKDWYRIAVRSKLENDELIEEIHSLCAGKKSASQQIKKSSVSQKNKQHEAVPVMIQGTMSNAGKSMLTAALCRIFKQDGYRVAPFKSQNMALNSGVTSDGLEMGRAQIMQAEAAGIAPDVRMNPILLKPCSDSESQIIVNGKVVKTMDAKSYFHYRKNLLPYIKKSYDSLAEENDIIVIEGAGSPAEINLKQNDIANMGMANLVDSPVILAGDIDRGGVFASIYGTIELLDENERQRIKGIIINKFRGDESILKPGIKQLESLVSVPTIGVVPYIQNLDIDDEDSLSSEDRVPDTHSCAQKQELHKSDTSADSNSTSQSLHIVVISVPYLSNSTDVAAFRRYRNIHISYVHTKDELHKSELLFGKPDMIVIPGTKNTIAAMTMMQTTGLDREVYAELNNDTPIIGICGGYQLLGVSLHDPDGTEGGTAQQNYDALGLLPVETVFTNKKQRVNESGILPEFSGVFSPLSHIEYAGYEIHQGVTTLITKSDTTRINKTDSEEQRYSFPGTVRGNVLGTYLHGFFDSDEIVRALIKIMCIRRGIEKTFVLVADNDSYEAHRRQQYDMLADVVRNSIDMKTIYKILKDRGLSVSRKSSSKKSYGSREGESL